MRDVVVVSGSRTAIGGFGGGLMNVPVVDLGAVVMKDVLKRINLKPVAGAAAMDFAPDKLQDQGMIELEEKSYDWSDDAADITIDEVIMGQVLTATGQQPDYAITSTAYRATETLELASGSGAITLLLNPDDYAALDGYQESLRQQFSQLADAEIVADPEISAGGCRVVTDYGLLDQQVETQLARIEQELTF